MKKLAKIFGAVAAIGAVVAGGAAIYRKFFAQPADLDDLDDELEEEFDDEDLDADAPTAERGYVSLNHLNEETKEEAPATGAKTVAAPEEIAADAEAAAETEESVAETAEEAAE